MGGALLLENAGIPVPGETMLLLASFLAYSEHDLQLSWHHRGGNDRRDPGRQPGIRAWLSRRTPLLERYQSFFRIQKPTVERGERLFARYGSVTIFFARFVFGMRIIAGPLAGVFRMPWKRFLLFNFWARLCGSALSPRGIFFRPALGSAETADEAF